MWKEIITVRTRIPDIEQACRFIRDFFNMQTLPRELSDYQIYRSSIHQNEAMLELYWDSLVPDTGGSELANGLVFLMKNIGLVNLSIWQRMKEI